MVNQTLLLQLIQDIESEYLEFSDEFYSSNDIDISRIKNLKKYGIGKALKDNYFMFKLLPMYRKTLMSINFDSCFMNYIINYYFRIRIKLSDSIHIKLKHYHYLEKKHGTFYIGKSLNDIWGARIVIPNVNNDIDELKELFDTLSTKDNNFKYYIKNSGSYRAVHCYFQAENKYFPWELQIWDVKDKVMNTQSHDIHEKEKRTY